MKKEWFAASALEGMNGLAKNSRNIRIKAKKEGWKKQKRSGRGGGYEYHISSLPIETQKALISNESGLSIVKECFSNILRWIGR